MSDDERDWGKIAMAGAVIFLLAYLGTNGFTNMPTFPVDEPPPQPGIQTKSTVVFYNGSACQDGTIQLVSTDGIPKASGAILAGTGTTGTVLPGTYFRYISGVSGAAVFIDTVVVEEIDDVAQTYSTLPAVQLYRNSTTYSVMMAGAGSAYTRDHDDALQTNKNFTMTAQVNTPFSLTMTESMGYAQFLEAYTDPISRVSTEPILWIKVTSTNIYSTSTAIKSFEDATYTYFLMPLSAIFNPRNEPNSGLASFSLTAPTAGDIAYEVQLVSYSDMTTLQNAETQVANAAGPFTITVWSLCAGWLEVS